MYIFQYNFERSYDVYRKNNINYTFHLGTETEYVDVT